MQLDRAKALALEYGKKLVQGEDYSLDLHTNIMRGVRWEYEDSLHPKQIAEMEEEDFIEYYLK